MKHPLIVTAAGLCLTFLAATQPSQAQEGFLSDVTVKARAGYHIGGTAPINMPRSIRKLNSYTLQPNFSLGIDAEKPLGRRFGVLIGLRFENKGMKEGAKVKNYHEQMVRGGETLEGMFTGDVTTKVREWMFTIPVQATWHASRKVAVRVGPYVSILTTKGFTGDAHNGYLRVGDPTGMKVLLGDDEGTRGTYDFSEHMRRVHWGFGAAADWTVSHRFALYAGIDWGLNGIHHSSFKVIDQTLYPIFGTVGVSYQLK